MKSASPYLTHQEAADYLRFITVNAFDCWRSGRKQAGYPVRVYRRGRVLLFKQSDLDAAVEPSKLVVKPTRGLHAVAR